MRQTTSPTQLDTPDALVSAGQVPGATARGLVEDIAERELTYVEMIMIRREIKEPPAQAEVLAGPSSAMMHVTKVMRNVTPFLTLPERLPATGACKSWRCLLPSGDIEICRSVTAVGLLSVIDKKWDVGFHYDAPCGWDSVTCRLRYHGSSPILRKKFSGKPVEICFGRWRVPPIWKDGRRDQHDELERVMRQYGIRKADAGEGKLAFLKAIVGAKVLAEHIGD